MITLHYAPDNASLVLRLAMEEAGIPYRTVLVDRSVREQESAAYRALNPTGLIPTLETPDGPIAETGACLLWLADRHPGSGLAPAVGAAGRGDFLRWLFFLSNTVHADLRTIFYPDLYFVTASAEAQTALTATRMQRHFALLDDAASARASLFAAPSALIFYAATLLRWCALYPEGAPRWLDLAATPTLHRLAVDLETRPATRRSAGAEGLGPHPFTAPEAPVPPEGSAL